MNFSETEILNFWMVYGAGRLHPKFEHSTKASAMEEAKRLSRLYSDTRFVVLEAVDAYVCSPIQPKRLSVVGDLIPIQEKSQ